MRRYEIKKWQGSGLGIRYEEACNEEQLAVVMAEREPLLVLAGAGSGKTRALVYRVARLIDCGLAPESILLLTFTNRAARNMLTRVEELCGAQAQFVRGGTFHHVALGFLRQHAETLGYGNNFTVLGRDDGKEVMNTILTERVAPMVVKKFPKAEVLLDMVSLAINTQTPIHEVIFNRYARFCVLSDDIGALAQAFLEKKLALNVMDFDDLLLNLKLLLAEHPEQSALIRGTNRAVLVDEYQDTNRLQSEIVDLFAQDHQNLTVVGDDAQSIYAFRGADVGNMLAFNRRYPAAKLLALGTNYRSTPQILDLANCSLQHAREGFKKNLVAVRSPGALPALVSCRHGMMQASFVAQRILELHEEGVSLDEIAVLYRAHHHALEIQLELSRRQIPFQVRSGLRFFEQAHIKDVMSYLRLLYNPSEEFSFKRAVKLHDGIGNVSAERMWRAHNAGEPEQKTEGARRFCALLAGLGRLEGGDVGVMIRYVLDEFYEDQLFRRFTNAEQRRDDIKQLAEFASSYRSLDKFLNELLLMQELGSMQGDAAETSEKVTLSSVHQAKGLEWGHVFVVWLNEGRFPSEQSLREPRGIEEERRLFYVAVTRAKDSLALCYPSVHMQSEHGHQLLRRSRFVEEIVKASSDESPRVEHWILEEEDAHPQAQAHP